MAYSGKEVIANALIAVSNAPPVPDRAAPTVGPRGELRIDGTYNQNKAIRRAELFAMSQPNQMSNIRLNPRVFNADGSLIGGVLPGLGQGQGYQDLLANDTANDPGGLRHIRDRLAIQDVREHRNSGLAEEKEEVKEGDNGADEFLEDDGVDEFPEEDSVEEDEEVVVFDLSWTPEDGESISVYPVISATIQMARNVPLKQAFDVFASKAGKPNSEFSWTYNNKLVSPEDTIDIVEFVEGDDSPTMYATLVHDGDKTIVRKKSSAAKPTAAAGANKTDPVQTKKTANPVKAFANSRLSEENDNSNKNGKEAQEENSPGKNGKNEGEQGDFNGKKDEEDNGKKDEEDNDERQNEEDNKGGENLTDKKSDSNRIPVLFIWKPEKGQSSRKREEIRGQGSVQPNENLSRLIDFFVKNLARCTKKNPTFVWILNGTTTVNRNTILHSLGDLGPQPTIHATLVDDSPVHDRTVAAGPKMTLTLQWKPKRGQAKSGNKSTIIETYEVPMKAPFGKVFQEFTDKYVLQPMENSPLVFLDGLTKLKVEDNDTPDDSGFMAHHKPEFFGTLDCETAPRRSSERLSKRGLPTVVTAATKKKVAAPKPTKKAAASSKKKATAARLRGNRKKIGFTAADNDSEGTFVSERDGYTASDDEDLDNRTKRTKDIWEDSSEDSNEEEEAFVQDTSDDDEIKQPPIKKQKGKGKGKVKSKSKSKSKSNSQGGRTNLTSSGKREANTYAQTPGQQMDAETKGKMDAVAKPLATLQIMSMPESRAAGFVVDSDASDSTQLVNERRYPIVNHGLFCYTEQKANPNGGGKVAGTVRKKPVFSFFAGSPFMAEQLEEAMKQVKKGKLDIKIHATYEEHKEAVFGDKSLPPQVNGAKARRDRNAARISP